MVYGIILFGTWKMEKYKIIENDIREKIKSQEYLPNCKLPTEKQLAEQFDSSRITVRKALQNLAIEGLIQKKIGDGTYVSEPTIVNVLGKRRSFSEEMISNGKVPGSELIEFKICRAKNNKFIAGKLKLKDEEMFYSIVRLRTGDGVPIALNYTYIPFSIMPNFDVQRIENGSLYEYLSKKNDLAIDKPHLKTTSAVMPDRFQKKYLKIIDEPLLKICHPSELADGKIFEYSETYYVGSRFVYTCVD